MAMKFTIELDIGLSFLLQAALPLATSSPTARAPRFVQTRGSRGVRPDKPEQRQPREHENTN
jgi:hypothetical protein